MLLLATLSTPSLTGCIIAEAPDYGEPRRTTPVIDWKSVTPNPVYRLTVRPEDPPVPFTMTVRSEDAGQSLYAVPVLNWHIKDREEILRPFEVPARAADQPKNVRVELDLAALLPQGCHTITILVMHTSSFKAMTGLPIDGVADDDVASITWWADALTPVDGEVKPCPVAEVAR